MSIMRCEKHDRNWDSDIQEECPLCNSEYSPSNKRARQMKPEEHSATPRTDGLLVYLSAGVVPDQIPHSWVEPLVDFARQLERDRARLVEFARGLIADAPFTKEWNSSRMAERFLRELGEL
jgi:hypothetical protein